MEVATNRLNEINYNTQGCKMWIDQYNSYKDIIVKFENGFTKHTSYQAFKKGEVINNFHPNVINGHGYLGNSKSKQNGKHKKSYLVWRSMLERCYDKNFHKKESSYINCSVCNDVMNGYVMKILKNGLMRIIMKYQMKKCALIKIY